MEGRGEKMELSRVEVAAARVDPERPSGEAGGFPSGEREGVVEKGRERGNGERGRRGGEGIEEGGVVRGERGGGVEEGEIRGRGEPEEGVGLVGPVEPTGSARVTRSERVLGSLVVGNGLVDVVGLVLREMVGEAGRGGVYHCLREKRG